MIKKSAVLYSNNNKSSTKSKYIDIKFLIVKEMVQSDQLSIEHINTNSMIANPLTKVYHPRSFMSTLLIWVLYQLVICDFSGIEFVFIYHPVIDIFMNIFCRIKFMFRFHSESIYFYLAEE